MFRELPLLSGGVRAGRAEYEESQLRLRFRCCLPGQQEVCKLWLAGKDGRLLLGTPAPQGEGLYLERSLTRSSLADAGVYPPERVEVEPAQVGPGPERSQNSLPIRPRDPVIAAALAAERPGRWQRVGDRWQVAYPWQPGQPMPLLPLFCFAHVSRGEVSFLLSDQGYPAAAE
ncbi:MAG: hypothetical protein LIO45_00445 [Clostridiales bacterium]|nr:hypothetical protein [Clostridiales bacterium]